MITAQEKEIMCRLAWQGEDIKQVAANMQMSPRNVDYHIGKLKDRFGVRTLAQLTAYLVEKKMLHS